MSVEENKSLVRRFLEEVWNKGNLALVDELIAADYVYHHPTGMVLHGIEQYKKLVNEVRTAFPDIHFTIDDIIAESNKVVYRWTLRGSHKNEFRGIPPTGKMVTMWGIFIDLIAGGKFVESWDRYDTLGLMRQLGVISK
jgi:steroid delta-isomerase-like uncharacterized protein